MPEKLGMQAVVVISSKYVPLCGTWYVVGVQGYQTKSQGPIARAHDLDSLEVGRA